MYISRQRWDLYLQVYVHPPGMKAVDYHRKLRYDRPVLAARYEPSTRILAMLAPASSSHACSSSEPARYSIVFCALSPDYAKMQESAEVPVDDSIALDVSNQTWTSQGMVNDPPFVLLPAAKKSDGSGGANKVRPSTLLHSRHSLSFSENGGGTIDPGMNV